LTKLKRLRNKIKNSTMH